jgi:hypothetical protein
LSKTQEYDQIVNHSDFDFLGVDFFGVLLFLGAGELRFLGAGAL